MARMPDVVQRSVVGPGHPRMTRYDIVCIHTIVGFAPGGTAAHFTTSAGGEIVQCRDTVFRSAANLEGNHRVIAIENEDKGPRFGPWNDADGHAVPAFTPEQCESIARICAWAHTAHAIPLRLAPDSRPASRGIAYHRQGVDGNFGGYAFRGRVPGGEVWTRSFGKVCPGDRRIRQLIEVIIPRARELAGPEEDELNFAQNAALSELWQVVVSGQKRDGRLNADLGFILNQITAQLAPLRDAIAALSADPDITAAQVAQIVDASVALHTPSAHEIVAAQMGLISAAVHGAVGNDAQLAEAIIDQITAALPADPDA